mmetsp:Transcript_22508/g.76518  ORF Transcript_22508/g.76518 Transcript_22508/m.76518 type:complete len:303 (+) Transcript_22508:4274-5182(+)
MAARVSRDKLQHTIPWNIPWHFCIVAVSTAARGSSAARANITRLVTSSQPAVTPARPRGMRTKGSRASTHADAALRSVTVAPKRSRITSSRLCSNPFPPLWRSNTAWSCSRRRLTCDNSKAPTPSSCAPCVSCKSSKLLTTDKAAMRDSLEAFEAPTHFSTDGSSCGSSTRCSASVGCAAIAAATCNTAGGVEALLSSTKRSIAGAAAWSSKTQYGEKSKSGHSRIADATKRRLRALISFPQNRGSVSSASSGPSAPSASSACILGVASLSAPECTGTVSVRYSLTTRPRRWCRYSRVETRR